MNNDMEVKNSLPALLGSANIKKKFEDILGKKAAGFMSSILSAVNLNPELKNADPLSVISAAAIAASLDLPINPSLGFAYIVPYKKYDKSIDQKDNKPIAQFQMGWKGFVQLAQRTGQYQTLNVSPVCEGELLAINPFTGEINLSHDSKKSDKIIGYVAYFKLLNGFEKYCYMTKEECEKHGKKYSKSYDKPFSKWQQDFDVMALKTVIKRLLGKWGILSIDMQTALESDQAIIKQDETYEYVDNETGEIGTLASVKIPKSKSEKKKIESGEAPDRTLKTEAEQKKIDEALSKIAEQVAREVGQYERI